MQNYFRPAVLVELIAIAASYVISARIGQVFAIAPGNITPVWFPSGIMLAWVFLRGYYVWPGIFLGAYLGNTWVYADYSTIQAGLSTLVSGSMDGLGDVCCAIAGVYFYRRFAPSTNPVSHLRPFVIFLFMGGLLGPLSDALLSVTGLLIGNFLPLEDSEVTFLTRLIGDMTGILLVTPLILINFDTEAETGTSTLPYEKLLYVLLIFLLSVLYIGLGENQPFGTQIEYVILPLLLWSSLRFRIKATFISAFYFSFLLMISQSVGYSAFPSETELSSVLALQFFIVLTISSVFIIGFMIKEREQALNMISELNQQNSVTGAYTQQFFRKALNEEIRRQARSNEFFSLILVEIEQYEDLLALKGMAGVERIQAHMVRLIRGLIHEIDILAHWSDGSFIILLPGIGKAKAESIGDEIRQVFAHTNFSDTAISTRIAVAEFSPGAEKEVVLAQLERNPETA